MNKLIVVTGGTKGIGSAIIEKFAAKGFEIITCARNVDDLNALKKVVEKQYSVKVHASVVDVSKKNEVEAFGDFITAIGEIHVLVNNAGIFVPGQVHDEADGIFEQLMTTNLNSAYYLSRKLIPSMKSAKRGHIFNMCSTASIMPYVN